MTSSAIRRPALGAAGVLGFLVLVEYAGRLGIVRDDVLPYASAVLSAAAQLTGDGEFHEHVLATLEACAAGLAIAGCRTPAPPG